MATKKKAKAKQTKMAGDGFERQDANPAIEKAAEVLDDIQTERMDLTKKEVEARTALADVLKKANLIEYKLDSGKVAKLTTTTKATVRKPKEEPDA